MEWAPKASHEGLGGMAMTQREFDDAIAGAGVIGLAHAYHLAMRGRRVIVFERSPLPGGATGASIRNFGMIWPIGQPVGEMYELARRSRELWLDALQALSRSPAIKPDGLRGAMWSPIETCVDPREVIANLPGWLSKEYKVRFVFDCAVASYNQRHALAGGE